MNLFMYLIFTTVINYQIVCTYVFDCTIWGFHPLGKPAELTAQYLILNLTLLSTIPLMGTRVNLSSQLKDNILNLHVVKSNRNQNNNCLLSWIV